MLLNYKNNDINEFIKENDKNMCAIFFRGEYL